MMRPYEEYYWNPTESDSDESVNNTHVKQPYIDPWDLENYAYIREHLESTELSSSSSVPRSSGGGGGGYGGSAGEFSDINSNLYRPIDGAGAGANRNRRFSEMRGRSGYVDMSGDYADIDEVQYVSRRLNNSNNMRRQSYAYDYDLNENPYEEHIKNNPVFGIYDQNGRFRKVTVPISTSTPYKVHNKNFMSPYGEYVDYDPYASKHEIYSKLDEMSHQHSNRPMPIYDDVRRMRTKPNNFGLTNYGHLKIDYSLNWNDLNNYIRYNS